MSKEKVSMDDKLNIIKKKKVAVVETTEIEESDESEYTYSSSDEEIIIRKKDKNKAEVMQPIAEAIAEPLVVAKVPEVDVIAELALIKQLLSQRRKKSNSKTVVQIMQPPEKDIKVPEQHDRMKQYSFLKF